MSSRKPPFSGDALLQHILEDPRSFVDAGRACDLLHQFLEGYPLDKLKSLLHQDNPLVLEAATWIASELGHGSSDLLWDVIPLLSHHLAAIRISALEVVAINSVGSTRGEYAKVPPAMQDPDPFVAQQALFLMANAEAEQLRAAQEHFETVPNARTHQLGLRRLIGGSKCAMADVDWWLHNEDTLIRRYFAVWAARNSQVCAQFLPTLAKSDDQAVRMFAERRLLNTADVEDME